MSDLFLPEAVLESPNLVVERDRTGPLGQLATLDIE
jgi:hypothetical protein